MEIREKVLSRKSVDEVVYSEEFKKHTVWRNKGRRSILLMVFFGHCCLLHNIPGLIANFPFLFICRTNLIYLYKLSSEMLTNISKYFWHFRHN